MKHLHHEIKGLLEQIISAECRTADRGLWFSIDEVEPSGKPISIIKVWATLHYLPSGSPFNNTEPHETLWLFGDRLERICDEVRCSFRLQQAVAIDFVAINANVHTGVIDMAAIYLSALMGQPQDINVQSDDGLSPLMYYAGVMPDHAIVDLLLRSGADLKLRDKQGRTAMDYAKRANPTEQLLIESLLDDAQKRG